MCPHGGPDPEQVRSHVREHLRSLFHIDDSSGLELLVSLQATANLLTLLDTRQGDETGVSVPRWRLLLRLLVEEEVGNRAGVTPTELSRSQRVSKNTISSLLRGLEAQGLIRRTLDPDDLRAFRIQLAPAGRDYLMNTAPGRVESLNRLLSGLDREERQQLTDLLNKLLGSLAAQCHRLGKEATPTGADAAEPEFTPEETIAL